MKFSNMVETLALSALCATGPIVGIAVAQPGADAPKGDNPPNAAPRAPRGGGADGAGPRGPRGGNRGENRGDRGGNRGQQAIVMLDSEDAQEIFGQNLTDTQKAQLTASIEARDKAIEAAQQQFQQQLMQVSGLSEQELGQKVREHMQQQRANRPEGANRPERPADGRPEGGNRPGRQ